MSERSWEVEEIYKNGVSVNSSDASNVCIVGLTLAVSFPLKRLDSYNYGYNSESQISALRLAYGMVELCQSGLVTACMHAVADKIVGPRGVSVRA